MALIRQIQEEKKQLEQAVTDAIEMAKKLGADDAEVSISKQTGISVNTRHLEVENIEFNRDGALGISVYKNSRKGSSSTSDLSHSAIMSAVEAAIEIAKYTSEDKFAGLADKELLETQPQDLDLCFPEDMEPEFGLALAKECEEVALSLDPRVTNSDGASYSSHCGIKVYGNTNDFVQGYASSRHSLSCMLIGELDGDMQRDYSYTMARDRNDLLSASWVAEDAVKRTAERLGARKISTRTCPVLFSPDCATGLFGHLVMAISGGSLYRKSSFLLDSLGTQIFPEWLSIEEFPHLKKGLASSPFDGEGVKTQDRSIIKDGRLETYLMTSYSGRKMGMQSTGHAGGIHNWFVKTGENDLPSLLKQMGTGLYVTELMGQGVNIVNGDYSRGAAGFWVENGEFAFPVHEITIAGNLKDMYMGIQEIGKDIDIRSSLKTGSVLIDNMKLAGH